MVPAMDGAREQHIRGASCALRLLRSPHQLVPDNSRVVLHLQKLLLFHGQGGVGAAAQGAALHATVNMLGKDARNGWLQRLDKLAQTKPDAASTDPP